MTVDALGGGRAPTRNAELAARPCCRTWMIKPFAVCALLTSGCAASHFAIANPALASRAVPLRTVSPDDDSFDDLRAFATFVGDAQVVTLGESHGDGTSQLLMSRLVRFLHEVKGFDVLVFESGLLETEAVDAALATEAPLATAVKPIPSPWSQSELSRPLFAYLRTTKRGPRPFTLAGFDTEVRAAALTLLRLERLLAGASIPLDAEQRACLGASFDPKVLPCTAAVAEALLQALARSGVGDPIDREQATRFLRGLLASIEMRTVASGAPDARLDPAGAEAYLAKVSPLLVARDAAMGENLRWLVDRRFAGKKIIFWGARGHLSLAEGFASRPMLAELGPRARSVTFTFYQGTFGLPWTGVEPVEPSEPNSLEGLLHATGRPLWFVDQRGATDPLLAPEAAVHDGVFFIDVMRATAWAPDSTKLAAMQGQEPPAP